MGEHHGVDRDLPGHPQRHSSQVAQVHGNPKPSSAPVSTQHADRVHPALHATGNCSLRNADVNCLVSSLRMLGYQDPIL